MNDPTSSPLMRVPHCTYRLQFNREFTFRQATEIAPYLHKLGISHCYASPYLKARPGSMHGYDIIDHNAINPEIGTEDDYRHYADTLQGLGLGQILDIVPNHMGIMGSDNAWWLDVLEHGPASMYAGFFDIDWSPLKRALVGKVLLPVLGDHYGAVLERGELKLAFEAAQGVFAVHYFEHLLPLDPREYPRILRLGLSELKADAEDDWQHVAELQSLVTAFEHLPERTATSPEQIEERQRDARFLKSRLADLSARWPRLIGLIDDHVRAFNGEHEYLRPGLARFESMHQLLDAQAYRVAYWRVAADEINYRRFFDINDLAALRMEDPRVFEATHALVLDMVARGELDGLRIDHPDGLHDPVEYFFRLQDAAPAAPDADKTNGAPGRLYVLVEKILAAHEHLPVDWPVAGTSGYDFTNLVNGVFIDQDGQKPLDRTYARFTGHTLKFDDLLYDCKRRIIRRSLSSELHVLGNRLSRICEADPRSRDYTLSGLRDALQEIVACFPVYRTYITFTDLSAQDRQYVDWAVAQAKKRSQADETSVFDFIRAVLLKELPEDHAASAKALIAFAMQFQQYTSPVMAKGLEDTAMYNYNRLMSLNEVGGDPARFGLSVSAFHHHGRERAKTWPHAMLATTTHDTKRSEDVRARINVLSELARDWDQRVTRWARINRSRKHKVDEQLAPDRNDEYLLYQTLIGSWPLHALDEQGHAEYVRRIKEYMQKVAREAKRRSSWLNPDESYEQALNQFVASILDQRGTNLFLDDFLPFQQRIARIGMYNSLAQCLLKFTMPGVPDIYQGNELWDFSLVDPDNRRPVDYGFRARMLNELLQFVDAPAGTQASRVRELLDTPQDSRIKLYVTWKLLNLRREHPALFRNGDYQALETHGPAAGHLCAYARATDSQELIVVAPRLLDRITSGGASLPVGEAWANTWLLAPAASQAGDYLNVLTGEPIKVQARDDAPAFAVSEIYAHLPVAVLMRSK